MTALDWSTATLHLDVVCPSDPEARCRHCGGALREHIATDGPEQIPTPWTAVCMDQLAFAERKAIRYLPFELADGERLDCPNVGGCGVCDVDICSEHSNEFTTCVDNSAVMHHLDCRHACPACSDAARDDERNRS